MSMSTMPTTTTHAWLEACAPPPRKIKLVTIKPAVTLKPQKPFLERVEEDRARALRHVHVLPLPALLRGAIDYVQQHIPNDEVTPAEHAMLPRHSSIFTGGELIASTREFVVRAAAVLPEQPVFATRPRGGDLKVGWALYMCGGGAGLMLLVAPPTQFGDKEMREFADMRQYRYATWESTDERPFTPAEQVWATLYDCASQEKQRPKFFVVSTYNKWMVGCFSKHMTTAWVSEPLALDLQGPNIAQVLVYWLASASGASGAHVPPALSEGAHYLPRRSARESLPPPHTPSAAPALRLLELRNNLNKILASAGKRALPDPGSWESPIVDTDEIFTFELEDENEAGQDDRPAEAVHMLARLGRRLHRCPDNKSAGSNVVGSGTTLFSEIERAVAGVTLMMEDFAFSCQPLKMDDYDDENDGVKVEAVDLAHDDEDEIVYLSHFDEEAF